MIKTDVMDSVPQEPGHYLCQHTTSNIWDSAKVMGGTECLIADISSHTTIVREENFVHYTWSERIGEPSPDVDNLD